ncbi:SdrD B-like domain-containing protein [Singulisphaera sp. PoT]|uniref:SdrD B-like domain-containing protein n=1 Tax=Singulisphaera sp. PoT TaxID=3411797 RepID=UPI003BF4BFE3
MAKTPGGAMYRSARQVPRNGGSAFRKLVRRPYIPLSPEPLEVRITPAVGYTNIAQQLTILGDIQPGGTSTTVSSDDGPIEIGLYTATPEQNFVPMLVMQDGELTFGTEDNPTGDFDVTGSLRAYDSSDPTQGPILASGTDLPLNATNIVNGGGSISNPYTYDAGRFHVEIDSLGFALDPHDGDTLQLAIRGEVDIPLPGKGPDGTSGNKISVAIQGSDVLYYNIGHNSFEFGGLSVAITGAFAVNGLTFKADGLTLDFADQLGTFSIYGKGSVTTTPPKSSASSPSANDSVFALDVAVDLGVTTDPGLAFDQWDLQNLNVDVTGGFQLGGLQVHAEDLTIIYRGPDQEIAIGGGISLTLDKIKFTASLEKSDGTPGLFIDPETGAVEFEELELKMSDLKLGAFSIKDFDLFFENETNDQGLDFILGGRGTITLPGDWSVFGDFTFEFHDGFELKDIGLSIQGPGIPIGDTDIFVTEISGQLDGFGTSDWSLSGSIGLAFGNALNINGQDVRIIQAYGAFTVDDDELDLQGDIGVAASIDLSTHKLSSIIGTSIDGNVKLDWSQDIYSVQLSASFLDGLFTASGSFLWDNGSFVISAMAAINVPTFIPIIGGKQIASADFLFKYDAAAGSDPSGFLAAWIHLPIIGDLGFKYDVISGATSFLGNSGVAGLQADASQQPQYNAYAHQFSMPDGSVPGQPAGNTGFNFVAQWPDAGGGDYYVTLTNSAGQVVADHHGSVSGDFPRANVADISGLVAPAGQHIEGMNLYYFGNPLPPDTYVITVYSQDQLDPASIAWTGMPAYTPLGLGEAFPTVQGSTLSVLNYTELDPAAMDRTKATLYLTTDPGAKINVLAPQGIYVGPGVLSSDSQGDNIVTATADLSKLHLPPGTYYPYFLLTDDFDTPVVSQVNQSTPSFAVAAALGGTLTETGDGRNRPLSGFTVYIDADGSGDYTEGDPLDITDADGNYAFGQYDVDFQAGQAYTVGVVLPQGGIIPADGGSAERTFTYNGTSATVDFQAWQETTIAGTVTDAGGGVGGVIVYLDLNDNGQYDVTEPRTGTLVDGTYQFVGLAPSPTPYVVRYILPQGATYGYGFDHAAVVVTSDPYARYDGNDFVIQRLPVIQGSITGSETDGSGKSKPRSGWTVQLLDSSGAVVATTVSDNNGDYAFPPQSPGTYNVREVPPQGWQQIAPYTTDPGFAVAADPFDGPVSAVVIADFNNDGKLDYTAFIQNDSQIDYFYGNGDGTFGGTHFYETSLPGNSRDMQAGDFNGDGYADLAVLGTDGTVTVVWGSQGGFSGSTVAYNTQNEELDTVYGMAVGGDFNTGGNESSLVVYGLISGFGDLAYHATVVQYSASAGFQATAELDIPTGGTFSPFSVAALSDHAMAIGDLNNDGDLDLFMNFGFIIEPGTLDYQFESSIFYGHGDGTFGVTSSDGDYSPDLEVPSPANGGPMALGDLNNDGILDAVTSDYSFFNNDPTHPITQNLYVLQQTAVGSWVGLDGNFASAYTPGLSTNGPFGRAGGLRVPQLAIANIAGGNYPDIVMVESPYDGGYGQALTYINQGVGGRGLAGFDTGDGHFFFTLTAQGSLPNDMAIGDLNGNGQLDLILGEATYGGGGSWYLINTSHSVVAAPTVVAAYDNTYTIDFDNLKETQLYGRVYSDTNNDDLLNAQEEGLAGVIVYADLNNNGSLDPYEPYTTTNAEGYYSFRGLLPGTTGHLRALIPSPESLVRPEGGVAFTIGSVDSTTMGEVDIAVTPRLILPVADAAVVPGQTLEIGLGLASRALRLQPSSGGFLVFTVDPGAPAGLAVDPGSGRLTWTPGPGVAPGVYTVTVRVRDTKNPLNTDTSTFTIAVLSNSPPTPPPPPPPIDTTPPQVVSLARSGFGYAPTFLVLTFNEALDPARARDVGNYVLTTFAGRRIPIALAFYDAGSTTVTLVPARRLPLALRYVLKVDGSSGGLTSRSGIPLDGQADGRAGGDYAASIVRFRVAPISTRSPATGTGGQSRPAWWLAVLSPADGLQNRLALAARGDRAAAAIAPQLQASSPSARAVPAAQVHAASSGPAEAAEAFYRDEALARAYRTAARRPWLSFEADGLFPIE